jgi:putative restriction endonuclease
VTKGVFLIRGDSIYADEPEHFYRFPQMYLGRALQMVGEWVVYMEPSKAGRRGYHAVAKVERVVPDPTQSGMHLAMIVRGSYLEFGRDVPWRVGDELVERGLLMPDGRVNSGRAVWAVRPLANADFNRIIDLGLVDVDEVLPRAASPQPGLSLLQEEQAGWEGPVDRATVLVSRTVRDRQFRQAVLHAYDGRCALTGMRLVNGGGRLETEAAHIMPVAEGGPDKVNNGLALSGTVHWMFDRGLIGLSDAGEILLSSKINDRDGVEKMILPNQRARWPEEAAYRPHPSYLAWHREQCFHG